MSDQEVKVEVPAELNDPLVVWRILMEPINHGFAAATREALRQKVPAHWVIEMLLNHLASVVAMIEPSGAREELVKKLVMDFSPMVRKHVEARLTTPGGILLPRAVQ